MAQKKMPSYSYLLACCAAQRYPEKVKYFNGFDTTDKFGINRMMSGNENKPNQ